MTFATTPSRPKLVPGGRAIVQVATREGTRQGWDQFHKTDIDLVDGTLVYRHQHDATGFPKLHGVLAPFASPP